MSNHLLRRLRACAFFALALAALAAHAQPVQMSAPARPERTANNPSDPQTRARLHTELAALYFQDGNMPVALEELRIALEADPRYAPAYNVRGLVRVYLREMTLAEDDFRQALRLAGDDPEINNNYGWFLCQTGQEREAIRHFTRAIANPLYQTPDRAYFNAGQCSLKLGDLAAAEDFFQKVLRLLPGHLPATLQLAHVDYRRGHYEAARTRLAEIQRSGAEPNADLLWLALRVERRLGNRNAEAGYANQLRRKFSASPEHQELLKGNFE